MARSTETIHMFGFITSLMGKEKSQKKVTRATEKVMKRSESSPKERQIQPKMMMMMFSLTRIQIQLFALLKIQKKWDNPKLFNLCKDLLNIYT